MKQLILSISPHIRSKQDTRSIMGNVCIALCPALIAAIAIFGWNSLLLVAVSVAACVGFEYLWCRLRKQKSTIGDLSAVVTGMLLGLSVPVHMPIWQLIVGDAIAILLVKELFGGLGCNFVNPALVGRVCLMFSFPSTMTEYACEVATVDALTSATPLAVLDQLSGADFMTLFLGQHGGVIGETCVLALLIGGIYLVVRGIIKPIIPLCFMGSTLLFSWIFGSAAPFMSPFAGGLMMTSIFMATDYVTTPITNWGKVIFGVGCGFFTAAIRCFANAAEGVTFAILLMNLLVPYINGWTRKKAFGGIYQK